MPRLPPLGRRRDGTIRRYSNAISGRCQASSSMLKVVAESPSSTQAAMAADDDRGAQQREARSPAKNSRSVIASRAGFCSMLLLAISRARMLRICTSAMENFCFGEIIMRTITHYSIYESDVLRAIRAESHRTAALKPPDTLFPLHRSRREEW